MTVAGWSEGKRQAKLPHAARLPAIGFGTPAAAAAASLLLPPRRSNTYISSHSRVEHRAAHNFGASLGVTFKA
jgi:hypothetical protein